jgi:uncharacterized protein YkwD
MSIHFYFSKKNILFLFLLCFFLQANAQQVKPVYRTKLPGALSWNNIQVEYYKLLNALRAEKKLSPLIPNDPILDEASFDQPHYMDSTRRVGHDQKLKRKETPQKRVFYYNGTHDQVGENCMMLFIGKQMRVKYSKEPIIANTEKEIATAMFLGWKNSPGHYKNMITPGYDVAGLGYYFNKDSSQIYCAQVFGAKPFVPRKGLDSPDNAYDVKESVPAVCNCFNSPSWPDLSKEISLAQGGDTVYMICRKLDKLKNFFNNAADGIYLDFVLREQFVCEKNNLLHGSPVYDGFMTKPVLFKDMIKNNRAPGNNFFAAIGVIPKEVKNLKYGLDYGVIKNGHSCQYVYVNSIPEKNLDALNLVPKWLDNPDLEIKKDTFNGVLKFNIPFERGKTTVSVAQKNEIAKRLEVYKPFVKSLKINTFSSVEGNEQINLKLQEERASMLKGIIAGVLTTEVKTQVEAKENWEAFYKEVDNTKFAYLKTLPKPKVKELLQSKKMLDSLDVILRSTRIAQVEVELSASIDRNSEPYILLGAYKKALAMGDSLNAFACQSRLMYYLRAYKITNNDITSVEIPGNRKYIAHLTNWVGLATNDPELFYTNKTRQMALLYSTIDTNFLPLQFNYCIMALKYIRELGDTIIPIPALEAKMRKCYKLKTSTDSMYVDYMLLNYNIMTAFNNYAAHRYEKIEKPLQEIKDYFSRHEITETEGVKLGLLFNMYAKYDWTLEILQPLLKKYPQNNDVLFLFIKTYSPSSADFMNEAEYAGLLSLAKKRDKDLFMKWIDEECFQLLRKPEIKTEYCRQ